MLKEICEQPESLRNVMRGRLLEETGDARLGGITLSDEELAGIRRIVITACGTSWHAALIGEYMLEDLAGIPVEVEYASEFRYRSPVLEDGTLVLAISQSGETADTLAALEEARARGASTMGIVNVVGSSIARKTDFGIYLHAGPEIGVASTKAFTSQIVALALFYTLPGGAEGTSPFSREGSWSRRCRSYRIRWHRRSRWSPLRGSSQWSMVTLEISFTWAVDTSFPWLSRGR